MAKEYRELLAACRTENEIHRLHIRLDTVITPVEFEAITLAMAMADDAPPAVSGWIARNRQFMRNTSRKTQPYARRWLENGLPFYFHPRRGPAGRTLVIGFAGDAHRLMVPLPIFLQHCRAVDFDLLLLRDPTRSYYLKGITGIADDFPGLLSAIGSVVDLSAYAQCVTIGASSGGLPAICTAIALGLSRAISLGGTSPTLTDDPRLAARGITFAPFDAVIAARGDHLPDIVVAFGAHNRNDRRKGDALRTVLPARFEILPGVTDHNMIAELALQGQLRQFLGRVLTIAAPAA